MRVSFRGWALHPGAEHTNPAQESEKLKEESVEGGAGAGPARALGTSDPNLRVSFLIVAVKIYQGLALGQAM